MPEHTADDARFAMRYKPCCPWELRNRWAIMEDCIRISWAARAMEIALLWYCDGERPQPSIDLQWWKDEVVAYNTCDDAARAAAPAAAEAALTKEAAEAVVAEVVLTRRAALAMHNYFAALEEHRQYSAPVDLEWWKRAVSERQRLGC